MIEYQYPLCGQFCFVLWMLFPFHDNPPPPPSQKKKKHHWAVPFTSSATKFSNNGSSDTAATSHYVVAVTLQNNSAARLEKAAISLFLQHIVKNLLVSAVYIGDWYYNI